MHQEFDHQLSMNDTVTSTTRSGVSFPGLLALGVCTICLLTFSSTVSSVLFDSDGPCSQIEARPQADAPVSGDEVLGPIVALSPDVRICEAVTMEGD